MIIFGCVTEKQDLLYDQEQKIVQLENEVEYLKQTLYDEIQYLKNDKS